MRLSVFYLVQHQLLSRSGSLDSSRVSELRRWGLFFLVYNSFV